MISFVRSYIDVLYLLKFLFHDDTDRRLCYRYPLRNIPSTIQLNDVPNDIRSLITYFSSSSRQHNEEKCLIACILIRLVDGKDATMNYSFSTKETIVLNNISKYFTFQSDELDLDALYDIVSQKQIGQFYYSLTSWFMYILSYENDIEFFANDIFVYSIRNRELYFHYYKEQAVKKWKQKVQKLIHYLKDHVDNINVQCIRFPITDNVTIEDIKQYHHEYTDDNKQYIDMMPSNDEPLPISDIKNELF